jgi:hypothetical protein
MNHYDEQSDDYTLVFNTFKWSVLNCDKEPVNVASTYNNVMVTGKHNTLMLFCKSQDSVNNKF